MKTKFLALILVVLSVVSCKNDKTAETEKSEEAKIDNELFRVSLDLIMKKNDNVHLYYTEDGTLNFTEENSIWSAIKGNEASQEIAFNLPKDVMPTAIRIDLGYGKNEAQSPIDIKTVRMSYFDEKFEVSGPDLFNYFYPTVDSSKRIEGTTQVAKLDNAQIVGPIMYPSEALLLKIKQMTQGPNAAK